MNKIMTKGITLIFVAIITISISSIFFILEPKNAITVMVLNSIIGGMVEVYLGYLIVKDVIAGCNQNIK